jgi:hypothetical protein
MTQIEQHVAQQAVIGHHSTCKDAVCWLLWAVHQAEDAPALHALTALQKTKGDILTDSLRQVLCSTRPHCLLNYSLYVIPGYFFRRFFK